ncbi:MAG: hypothetical protein ACXIUV_00365 [Alkalilacustris sp.]
MLTDTQARRGQSTHATLWQRWMDRFRKRRVYLATLRRLRGMTRAELDEMGISRGMISRVAFETAYGRKD